MYLKLAQVIRCLSSLTGAYTYVPVDFHKITHQVLKLPNCDVILFELWCYQFLKCYHSLHLHIVHSLTAHSNNL